MTQLTSDRSVPLTFSQLQALNVFYRIDFRSEVDPTNPAAGEQPIRPSIYLTDCDRAQWFMNQWWYPASPTDGTEPEGGIEPFSQERQTGLSEQRTSIRGLLASDLVDEADLARGIYRGATLTQIWSDRRSLFTNSFVGLRPARTWRIADIEWDSRGAYRIDLASLASYHLLRKRGDVTSRTCRYKLFSTSRQTGGYCNEPHAEDGSGDRPLFEPAFKAGHPGEWLTTPLVFNPASVEVRFPQLSITTVFNENPVRIALDRAHNLVGPWDPSLAGQEVRIPISVVGSAVPEINGTYASGVIALTATTLTLPTTVAAGGLGGTLSLDPSEDWFKYGLIQWTDPANPNSFRQIRDVQGSLRVSSAGVHPVLNKVDFAPRVFWDNSEFGECQLTTGCDFSSFQCANKFRNTVNFGGEPSLPGQTKVVVTPDVQ